MKMKLKEFMMTDAEKDPLVQQIEEIKVEQELKKYVQMRYPQTRAKKEIDFIVEFMKTGQRYKSYQKIFGDRYSPKVAGVLANRLLKRVNFQFGDYLETCGHDDMSIIEALDDLKLKNPSDYLKYISKFKGYDVTRVDLNVGNNMVLKIERLEDTDKSVNTEELSETDEDK
jgi:hypothetical protein